MNENTKVVPLTKEDKGNILAYICDVLDDLCEEGYNVFEVCLIGSQNYGLASCESDIDTIAIVIPSIEDIIQNKCPISLEKKTKKGICKVKDIRMFSNELRKGNLNAIECLYTPYHMFNDATDTVFKHDYRVLRDGFVSEIFINVIKCLRGHLYNLKRRVEKAERVNKSLAYVYLFEYYVDKLYHGYKFSDILFPDEETRTKIFNVKYGNDVYVYSFAIEKIESVIVEINSIIEHSQQSQEEHGYTSKVKEMFEDILRDSFRKELELYSDK